MSFFSNPFSIKRTKQRKVVSRSPLKFSAEETTREFGPSCGVIDVAIADRRINFDREHSDWNTADSEGLSGTVSSGTALRLEKQIEVLREENNMLKLKVDVLLNLVAESIAELSTSQK